MARLEAGRTELEASRRQLDALRTQFSTELERAREAVTLAQERGCWRGPATRTTATTVATVTTAAMTAKAERADAIRWIRAKMADYD